MGLLGFQLIATCLMAVFVVLGLIGYAKDSKRRKDENEQE